MTMPSETVVTDHFALTLGVTPGYFHANEAIEAAAVRRAAACWQAYAAAAAVTVTAVVRAAVAVYPTARGCPEGGETIVTIEGTRNPQYCADAAAWRDTVLALARLLRDEFDQTTAQVDFSLVDFAYLA